MSSVSNHTYWKILHYWANRLENNRYKIPFLLTKLLEFYSFSKNKGMTFKNDDSKRVVKENALENCMPEMPRVTIVIPAHIRNEFDHKCLNRLINRILSQTYKSNIVVVDDCSPYEAKKSPLRPTIEYCKLLKNRGPAYARNKGIDDALKMGSDVIVFTDIDCVPEQNWIKSIVNKYQQDKKSHIVSGMTRSFNRNWLGIYHDINGTLNGRRFKDSDLLLYGPTCNLAITSEVAYSVRFDSTFVKAAGEDIDFCYRAIMQGYNIKHCSEAITHHDFGYKGFNIIKNMMQFTMQFKKYSEGERILVQKIPCYYSYLNNTTEISAF